MATLVLTLPAVGLTCGKLITELLPVALACGVMVLVVTAVQAALVSAAPPFQLLLVVPIGAATYGATIWFGWPALLRETWAMIRKEKDATLPA